MLQKSFPVEVSNYYQNVSERQIRGVVGVKAPSIQFDTTGYNAMTITIDTGSTVSARIKFECSGDGINWIDIKANSVNGAPSNLSAMLGNSGYFNNIRGIGVYQFNKPARLVRVTQIDSATSATCAVNVTLFNGAISPNNNNTEIPNVYSFQYTNSSITGTSPVLIKAVASNLLENTIFSIQVKNVGSVACVYQIRSNATLGGASPNILFVGEIKPTDPMQIISFKPALKAGVSNLLEFVSMTDTNLIINIQGWEVQI